MLRDIVSAERLVPEWDELWQRCPDATTFQRPEWVFSWMQIFQPSTPLLIEFRHSNVLVGVAPLLIYQRGSERVLALMGGGISDYLDVLFEPAYAEEAVEWFWDMLPTISGWDTLELTDLPPTSRLLCFKRSSNARLLTTTYRGLTRSLPGSARARRFSGQWRRMPCGMACGRLTFFEGGNATNISGVLRIRRRIEFRGQTR